MNYFEHLLHDSSGLSINSLTYLLYSLPHNGTIFDDPVAYKKPFKNIVGKGENDSN